MTYPPYACTTFWGEGESCQARPIVAQFVRYLFAARDSFCVTQLVLDNHASKRGDRLAEECSGRSKCRLLWPSASRTLETNESRRGHKNKEYTAHNLQGSSDGRQLHVVVLQDFASHVHRFPKKCEELKPSTNRFQASSRTHDDRQEFPTRDCLSRACCQSWL